MDSMIHLLADSLGGYYKSLVANMRKTAHSYIIEDKSTILHIRQLALYSTDDGPSYVMELCPTRKKKEPSQLFLIFSSDMQDSLHLT